MFLENILDISNNISNFYLSKGFKQLLEDV